MDYNRNTCLDRGRAQLDIKEKDHCSIPSGAPLCGVHTLTWQHDIQKKCQSCSCDDLGTLAVDTFRALLRFLRSLLTTGLCVLMTLLLEHSCTLPLPSLHSSQPTPCAGRRWSYRLCLAAHSVITLFSSIPYHRSHAVYSHVVVPPLLCQQPSTMCIFIG